MMGLIWNPHRQKARRSSISLWWPACANLFRPSLNEAMLIVNQIA